ncbi:MAG TPA: phosphate ABC transporter permease subunit PstC [Chitinophagaceae bacterium]|nr:phosphate ABC transporter permease subunit PstC [Chitinophagaceae bacterium]HNF71339.1 phosphate ABC transporter permease subunit PstC [Chitinophagaceae bacterium]
MKSFFTRIQVGLLALSSLATTITVFLIIFFLFREGVGFFSKRPVEEGYVLAVHPDNPLTRITPGECKKVFDQEITDWKSLNGNSREINLLTLDEIGNLYSSEQMGENMEFLDTCYNDYIRNHKGVIAIIPEKNFTSKVHANRLQLDKNGFLSFIRNREWFPTARPVAQFGALPLLTGTLLVSLGAILLALPFGLACAIFMSELCNEKTRKVMKPVVELLAGIPSVVYGFFGLIVIVPLIQKWFHLDVGETALAGSIILGIMALPTIITISEDALRNVPKTMREAALAMGATKWQTIVTVLIPYARSGITTAAILGIGRAIGETMAVLMVSGNAANTTFNLLKPVRSIPATIAAELGEAPAGGIHFQALFALACILFLITFGINLYVHMVSRKKSK